jgi:hypothetical protein
LKVVNATKTFVNYVLLLSEVTTVRGLNSDC